MSRAAQPCPCLTAASSVSRHPVNNVCDCTKDTSLHLRYRHNGVSSAKEQIIRPHRSSTYVDAAYCYQPSEVVCRSVTLLSPAKMAAPIEMPFGLRTQVGPRNHVLDRGPDPPWEGANLRGKGASHCKA